VVAGAGGATNTTGVVAIDSANFVLMTQSFANQFATDAAVLTGLPDNAFFPADSHHRDVQLGWNQAGPNAIQLKQTGSFTVSLPAQAYDELQIFATSTGGGSQIQVTLTYADGSTETRSIAIADWAQSAAPGTFALVSGMARYNIASMSVDPRHDLSIWGADLAPDPSKALASFAVNLVSGGWLNFFGATGCSGAGCGAACANGSHFCGGACVTNQDVAHCGHLCQACTNNNGTATCDGTQCVFNCNAGYLHCPGDTGCDTNPTSDPNNCGGCGNSCGANGGCSAGTCDMLDQSSSLNGPPGGGTSSAQQTYVAGLSGRLSRVTWWGCSNGGGISSPTVLTVDVYSGSGTGGTKLGTSAVSMGCGGPFYASFAAVSIPQLAGSTYTLAFNAQSGSVYLDHSSKPFYQTWVAPAANCGAGERLCRGACVNLTDPTNCGPNCVTCPQPPNSVATCDGPNCGTTCNPGFTQCHGTPCDTDLNSSAANCGTCGSACTVAGTSCFAGHCDHADQSYPYNAADPNNAGSGSPAFQTYAAGRTGTLNRVLWWPFGGCATVTIEVYQGAGLGGSKLGSTMSNGCNPNWVYASFAGQNIAQASGMTYTLNFIPAANSTFSASGSNGYPNGCSNFNGSACPGNSPYDIYFQTNVY
jgi:hypothetical protein